MRQGFLLQASALAVAVGLSTHAHAQTAPASTPTSTRPAQAVPAPSRTSDQANAVGEVIVTSRRREERLRDVPETVVAISNAALKTHGIIDFDTLGQQTPGLVMSDRGTGVPDVTIRGVGSFGYVEGVGFYIDDVQNYTDQTMRLQDVDHLEILKGPQGTLFGGSSLGGAIRYFTKEPTFDHGGDVEAEGGSHNYENIYAAYNTPLLSDKAALRVSGYYTHDDGFQYDKHLQEPSAPAEEYSFRSQLLLVPFDHFSALLTFRVHDVEGGHDVYGPANSVSSPSFTTDLAFQPKQDSRTYAGVAKLNYDFGYANLTSITSYTTEKNKWEQDLAYSEAVTIGMSGQNPPSTDVYTQELRLTSEGNSWVSWVVGGYAARYVNAELQGGPLLILNSGGRLINPYLDRDTKQTDLALFGSSDFHMNQLTLTTGLRLNHTSYDATAYYVGGRVLNQTQSVDSTVPLPRASLSYKTHWDANLYVSASEGFESGKIDTQVSPHRYGAEKAWNYEAGVKGYALDKSLYYEFDAFYIDDIDRQFANLIIVNGLLTRAVSNIGDSVNKGVEGSVNWHATPDLVLDGSASYLNATWSKGSIYNSASVEDKAIPNAPEWTANMGATYTVHLPRGYKLSLHGDASYMGSYAWALTYSQASNMNPAYWLGNARIALTSPDGRWEFAVRGSNITNTKYFVFFDEDFYGPERADGTCNGCQMGLAGPGQRFIASLDVKF